MLDTLDIVTRYTFMFLSDGHFPDIIIQVVVNVSYYCEDPIPTMDFHD